jgi:hypothetical protein
MFLQILGQFNIIFKLSLPSNMKIKHIKYIKKQAGFEQRDNDLQRWNSLGFFSHEHLCRANIFGAS